MGITTTEPPARLLDLTRLVSRAGRSLTGVDRVEYAYLDRLVREPVPLFGLVRSALGFLLLDRAGCAELRARIATQDWPAPNALARLARRGDPSRAGAEAALRRVARGRALPARLGALLRRHLPAGTTYLNTGHTTLSSDLLRGLRQVPGLRRVLLLHDTIPLDFPQYQRPGAADRFRRFLDRVSAEADLLICNSAVTRADVARHLGRGRQPPALVAHLGVTPPPAGTAPDGPWRGQPYVVALGTIEPRKNHALLLDIWQSLSPPAHLLICGSRGWENAAVFAALDRGIARVHELPGLPDAAISALLRGSAGLVFPSHAEGYGLPPVEAAALGVPVLSADLPVVREIMGDIPVYAEVSDRYLWAQRIRQLADHPRPARPDGWSPPGWEAHFRAVLGQI
ncbi:glycosyltransferase family 4 protein [Salipiger marinus]|uniref:glycosyltransferase family 4 protein n=1 Tax=Salipiger marinus TaxID=555512 RepID=UPI004059A62D